VTLKKYRFPYPWLALANVFLSIHGKPEQMWYIAGMGYLNSICHKAWGVSEVEEAYNAITIHIAAHELGHK